jgi:hypothetical protein
MHVRPMTGCRQKERVLQMFGDGNCSGRPSTAKEQNFADFPELNVLRIGTPRFVIGRKSN